MDITIASVTQTYCPTNRPLVSVQIHSFLCYCDSRGYLIEGNTFEIFGEQLIGYKGSTTMNVDP